MTILDAIKRLQEIYAEQGTMEIKFDCPDCGKSFSPNKIIPETHTIIIKE